MTDTEQAFFPSPCGDYGSYLMRQAKGGVKMNKIFPSPCGDYGSYQRSLEINEV